MQILRKKSIMIHIQNNVHTSENSFCTRGKQPVPRKRGAGVLEKKKDGVNDEYCIPVSTRSYRIVV